MKITKLMTRLMTVVMVSAALTACGSKDVASPVTKASSPATEAVTTAEEVTEASAGKDEEQPENVTEPQAESKTEEIYEDNFAVETSAAAAFADKIKAAVAAKDIEALADLTAFPVYVGVVEGGVQTREEFVALGAEKVFTPELVESVEGADVSNLSPSMAGFSISKEGKSNIIFGVVEGRLAISGINYK